MRPITRFLILCIIVLCFPLILLVLWDILSIFSFSLWGIPLGTLPDFLLRIWPGGNVVARFIDSQPITRVEVLTSVLALLIVTTIKAWIPLGRISFKSSGLLDSTTRILKLGLLDAMISIVLSAAVMALIGTFSQIFESTIGAWISSIILFGILGIAVLSVLRSFGDFTFSFKIMLAFAKLLVALFAVTVAMFNGTAGALTAVLCIFACGALVMAETAIPPQQNH